MKPTPKQRDAIETVGSNLCVDAGAGSGKTGVLVARILHLLEHKEVRLERIVAITFTDKAASEMKDRLRKRCREQAPIDSPDEMTFWRKIERRLDTARISTIHSFCMALLKENALAVGMDPDFALLSEAELHLLRGEVVESSFLDLLEQARDPESCEAAHAAQRLATEHGANRALSMLRFLLERRGAVEQVLEEHPMNDPETVAEQWEEWAQKDRRERYGKRLEALKRLEGCCSDPNDKREILRQQLCEACSRVAENPNVTTLCAELETVLTLSARGGSKKKWDSEESFDAVRDIFHEIKKEADDATSADEVLAIAHRSAELTCDLATVYREVAGNFQQAKTDRTSCGFDDLILETLRVLSDNPEVRARTARGIQHLLIDEFQDTDSRQLEIARLLVDEKGGPELFVVGDAKQSIYRFRGAEVEVFGDARANADTHITLEHNFRSTPQIIRFVNNFFSRTGLLKAVENPYVDLVPERINRDISRLFGLEAECDKVSGTGNKGLLSPFIEFLLADAGNGRAEDYRRTEATLIADRVAQMCAGPERVEVLDPDTNETRPARFGDVAVLFRALSDVYLYEQAFRQAGAPVSVVAGAGFFERQEVRDLSNLLKVVVDPSDEMAVLGFLRSPIAGLSDDDLAGLCEAGRLTEFLANEKTSSFSFPRQARSGVLRARETLREDLPGAELLERARALVAGLRAHSEMPLPAFLRRVLNATGQEAILLDQDFLGVQKALNLRKVVELADGFCRARAARLPAFVRYIDEVVAEEVREGEAALLPEGSRSVTLMSIHKAKGLEFPIVILADLSRSPRRSGRSPVAMDRRHGLAMKVVDRTGNSNGPEVVNLIERTDCELNEAERARILYVGMTRARDRLLLSGAQTGTKGTWLERFVEEFGLEDIEDGGEAHGNGWQGTVRRALRGSRVPASTKEPIPEPSRDEIVRHIQPVVTRATSRRTFAVTELSPRMAGPSDRTGDLGRVEQSEHGISPEFRGTMAHRLFEAWDFASQGVPDIDGFVRRECPDRRIQAAVATELKAIAERFDQTPLRAILARQASLQREVPFVLRANGSLVSGTIDLLGSDGLIVDYKTGQRTPGKHAEHEQQIRLYAAAVQRLRGIVPEKAYLCYLDCRNEEEIVSPVDVSPECVEESLSRATRSIQALKKRDS